MNPWILSWREIWYNEDVWVNRGQRLRVHYMKFDEWLRENQAMAAVHLNLGTVVTVMTERDAVFTLLPHGDEATELSDRLVDEFWKFVGKYEMELEEAFLFAIFHKGVSSAEVERVMTIIDRLKMKKVNHINRYARGDDSQEELVPLIWIDGTQAGKPFIIIRDHEGTGIISPFA